MDKSRAPALAEEEQLQIREAFRFPRGRYTNERASHIAGIPGRTIYHWAHEGLLVPDFPNESPMMWSYRDLVMLRLFAWFRARSMPTAQASDRVNKLRESLAEEQSSLRTIRSDGTAVYLDEAVTDPDSPQMAFAEAVKFLGKFDLMMPLEGARASRRIWGPHLIHPTQQTSISPWVLAGEPCIRSSRIPTSGLYALTYERGLEPVDIAELYGDLSTTAIVEAVDLEKRMRSASLVTA